MNEESGVRVCWVCHDGDAPIPQNFGSCKLVRECACRGPYAGFAHLHCLVEAANHDPDTWDRCPNCRQDFTGDVRLHLAQTRWETVLARNLPPEDDWERLNAADCYAQALLVCKSDHERALPLFEEVLATSRTIDGDDDVNTLVSMNNLASLHQKMGSHDLALPLFNEALEAQRRTLGKDDPDTLRTVGNLAMLLLRQENFARSLPLAEEALEARQRTLGPRHVDTLESKHNLGLLRWHMAHGKYVSFHAASEHFGPCDLGDLKLASMLLREVLDARIPLLGEDHHLTKESRRALQHSEKRVLEIRASMKIEEAVSVPINKKRPCAAVSQSKISRSKIKKMVPE